MTDFASAGSAIALVGLAAAVIIVAITVWLVFRRPGSVGPEWQRFEQDAAGWLDRVGCRRVELTGAGADGGIDVVTDRWAVQVKATSKVAGRPVVQQTVAAAAAVDREPAVVSASGFSPQAIEAADIHQVALVDASTGRFERVNQLAHELGMRRHRTLLSRVVSRRGR